MAADFVKLREEIRANIKPNNRQEITGAVAQGVLVDMVDVIEEAIEERESGTSGIVLDGEVKPQYTPDSNGIIHLPPYPSQVTWDNISGKPSWIGPSKPTYGFTELATHPTTLSGYGITDAASQSDLDAHVTNDERHLSEEEKQLLSYFGYDEANHAVHLIDSVKDGKHLSFYAFGDIIAGGVGSGGGGSIGGVASVTVNGHNYVPDTNGIVTLPNYPSEVNWENIEGKPTWIGSDKPSYAYGDGYLSGFGSLATKSSLVESDIPSLDASKITSGTLADARIASADAWNAKWDYDEATIKGVKVNNAGNADTADSVTGGYVSSFGSKNGAITLRGGQTGNGSVNLAMSDNELQASIVGLGSAAFADSSSFASATDFTTHVNNNDRHLTAIQKKILDYIGYDEANHALYLVDSTVGGKKLSFYAFGDFISGGTGSGGGGGAVGGVASIQMDGTAASQYFPDANGVIHMPPYPTKITWDNVEGKPAFATVATSGAYGDLSGKPTTIAGYGITDAITTGNISSQNVGGLNYNYYSQGLASIPYIEGIAQYGIVSGGSDTAIDNYSQYTFLQLPWIGDKFGGRLLFGTNSGKIGFQTKHSGAWTNIKEIYHSGNLTSLSQLTDDVVSGHYLPLSGGTINGDTYISGNLTVTGESTSGSDARWKENIKTISDNPIYNLNPCEWDWREGHGDGHSAGLIAQEVAKYLPFAVKGSEDNGYTLNYNVFHAFEIAAIQNHETRIQQLERENAELKRQIQLLNS